MTSDNDNDNDNDNANDNDNDNDNDNNNNNENNENFNTPNKNPNPMAKSLLRASQRINKVKEKALSASQASSSSTSSAATSKSDMIVGEISQLLQQYEPGKVDKLQDLLAKFRGNEGVLLAKMKKRYSR